MLEIKNLTKTFGNTKALDNVSCSICPGSIFGLVGSNGSGKSTMLRLISGVYFPDDGDVLIDGIPVYDNVDIKNRVFFLADTPYFIHQSSISEMADFYSQIYANFSYERFNYLCSVFPLDLKMRISHMSKGMQRQAALMLAISTMPDYLLLDEAFDGLDPVMRRVLTKLLVAEITDRDMCVIISSHNLRELEDVCDHVGLIHQGNILFSDELDHLKSRLHKIQAAFKELPENAFEGLDIQKIEHEGSLYKIIVKGELDEINARIGALGPVFVETISLSLEELFIYELEVVGYDISNIID